MRKFSAAQSSDRRPPRSPRVLLYPFRRLEGTAVSGSGYWHTVRRQFQKGWMELTALRCPRLGPPCLAKRLSCARSMSSLPVRSGGKGVAGHSALRSNSRRVRGVSHCRDKLSQNQLGVLCRCCFSSFRRLAMGGGEESVVGSASTYSCRFRLRGIGVFSKGNES